MDSAVWSASCLLFLYTRCPRAQPFVKVGEHMLPVPYGVGAVVKNVFFSQTMDSKTSFSLDEHLIPSACEFHMTFAHCAAY